MIIFLYGEDTFRSRVKLKEFKDKFIREVDPSGNDIVVLNGETVNLLKIKDAASAASLFSRKKMVIVENVFKNKSKTVLDEIAEYFRKLKSDQENIIVFWDEMSGAKMSKNKLFNLLSKEDDKLSFKKFVQVYPALSDQETAAWLKSEIQKRGGQINPQAVFSLVAALGNDLWSQNNEIDKLVAYKKGEEITPADIQKMVSGKINENIFALTDAIGTKNRRLSIELLEKEIEAGAAEMYLLFMIMRQFKIMLQIRTALDKGKSNAVIASELKIHPYVVSKSSQQIRSFSGEFLQNILNKLIEIDYQIKNGQTELVSALELLLVRL